MLITTEKIALDLPWRFAVLPRGRQVELEQVAGAAGEFYEIDGDQVQCMRTFHEEVAADLFFASHYNCDPHAPLTYLGAPVEGEQVVICWHQSRHLMESEPEDWEAIFRMFCAAMVTLHPQGTYLRMILCEDDPAPALKMLQALLEKSDGRAGVGFDYEDGESHFDLLYHSKSRYHIREA